MHEKKRANKTKHKPAILRPGQKLVFRVGNEDINVGYWETDSETESSLTQKLTNVHRSDSSGCVRYLTLRFFMPRAEDPDR